MHLGIKECIGGSFPFIFSRGHCYLWQLNQDFIWISFILFLNLTYLFHHKKIFDWDYKVFLLRQGKKIYEKDTYKCGGL